MSRLLIIVLLAALLLIPTPAQALPVSLWLSAAEIAALPMSGAAKLALKNPDPNDAAVILRQKDNS
jgi:hypothetical protein